MSNRLRTLLAITLIGSSFALAACAEDPTTDTNNDTLQPFGDPTPPPPPPAEDPFGFPPPEDPGVVDPGAGGF